jgi:CheY-like chemotaxis protein
MGGELTLAPTPTGTTFTVRLQLPRVHALAHAHARATPTPAPSGYAGRRRRILVVDNERVDRELLVHVLQPLGFDTMQAGTGLECLRLYPAYQPDLILMDLAMPVMDGWEAARILRQEHDAVVPILIVSANAYDRNLDNPAGIDPPDFIVKPVNVAELLARIGVRLALDWTMPEAAPGTAPVPAPVLKFPPPAQVAALREQIALGYVRGIQRQLDALEAQHGPFADKLRQLAHRFDLEAMTAFLDAGDVHHE